MIKKIKHNDDRDTLIIYIENVIDDNKILKYLEKMDDFEGAEKYTPRLQKWYQKDKLYFSSLWKKRYKRWVSKEYDEYLLGIQDNIEKITNTYVSVKFNSCLINKYRDGSDIIKPHRDAIESFGEYPVISNLSIGSERTIKFENKDTSFDILLKSGSLLIMSGSSQKHFKHSIPESNNCDIRYSLTFRDYI
jgi:alkylated DNA repair dioxygenase AlkB